MEISAVQYGLASTPLRSSVRCHLIFAKYRRRGMRGKMHVQIFKKFGGRSQQGGSTLYDTAISLCHAVDLIMRQQHEERASWHMTGNEFDGSSRSLALACCIGHHIHLQVGKAAIIISAGTGCLSGQTGLQCCFKIAGTFMALKKNDSCSIRGSNTAPHLLIHWETLLGSHYQQLPQHLTNSSCSTCD